MGGQSFLLMGAAEGPGQAPAPPAPGPLVGSRIRPLAVALRAPVSCGQSTWQGAPESRVGAEGARDAWVPGEPLLTEIRMLEGTRGDGVASCCPLTCQAGLLGRRPPRDHGPLPLCDPASPLVHLVTRAPGLETVGSYRRDGERGCPADI